MTSLRGPALRGHSVPQLRERLLPAARAFVPSQTIVNPARETQRLVFSGDRKACGRRTSPDEPLRARKLQAPRPVAPPNCLSRPDGARGGCAAHWRCNRCRAGMPWTLSVSGSLGKLEQEIVEPPGYGPTVVASMRNWYCEYQIEDIPCRILHLVFPNPTGESLAKPHGHWFRQNRMNSPRPMPGPAPQAMDRESSALAVGADQKGCAGSVPRSSGWVESHDA